ncbi:hypothetical protein GOV04_00065 [Candidatus Woesearchaeota archaeon]|nr:hypothetical protein [Candidatus Woesearchaeota archaeon]
MVLEQLNSEEVIEVLDETLAGFEVLTEDNLIFADLQNIEPFKQIPGKPYTARMSIPATYHGHDAGELVVVAFRPGDGTGDDSVFRPGQLIIPKHYRHKENPQRVFPRKKGGLRAELFFPLFSLYPNGAPFLGGVSLEELVVDDPQNPMSLVKGWDLGLPSENYADSVLGHVLIDSMPDIELTTGHVDHSPVGGRFGDPHAIYFGAPVEMTQVAGFLAIPENRPDLYDLKLHAKMPEQLKEK